MMFEVDYATGRQLLNFSGATDAERAAARRLLAFQGTIGDVAALAPLADFLGIPWRELFPELSTTSELQEEK